MSGIIQLSKIQVRGGLEIELPGAPTSLNPLVFSEPLAPGELAFTRDTGRLFIGMDPTTGQPNLTRTAFPYQNVEILTENSTDVITDIIGTSLREISNQQFFYQADLQASVGAWQDILVNIDDTAPVTFVFNGSTLLCSIEYFVYAKTGDPLRQGMLHVLQDSTSAEAQIVESRVAAIRTDVSDTVDPETAESNINFRIYRSGVDDTQHMRFSYTNALPVEATMYFRVSRPIPNS